jgi:hypothetical protein
VVIGVGVLIPAGGDASPVELLIEVGDAVAAAAGVEPGEEPVADPAEPATAEGLPAGAGWFGGTTTGPGPKGRMGRGVQVGEAVGVGVGVGVEVAATCAITNPDGCAPVGRTTGVPGVELARSTATTSAALVEVVPSR